MFANLISSGSLFKIYPPLVPLILFTILYFFNLEKICSKKSKEIPCLNDISLKDTGLTLLNLARSAKAITAYLPFEVNFILSLFKWAFYTNLTKLVKYTIHKKDNILSLSYDMCIFFENNNQYHLWTIK